MKLFPAFFLFLLLLPGIAKAGDETWINEGLQENEGGSYTLPAGTHAITDKITVPDNTIFKGEVSESGELLSKIVLGDYVTLGKQVPLVTIGSNCKVLYLAFDGNQQNQDVPKKNDRMYGNGYHNFIGAQYVDNVEVAYNNFENNLGDGLRIHHSNNIDFHDNVASKGGHDVLYALFCEGIRAYNNTIYPKVNSALRVMSCSHVRFYDNYIEHIQGGGSAGPAIQVQNDEGVMQDVEICNNVIVNSCGSGMWLVDKTGGNSEIWIHHNLFLNSGTNPNIYWVGGIISSGYDNARIENNVFDGSFLGAVNFWDYSKGSWGTTATAYLDSNIFTSSEPGKLNGVGGYGVNNEIAKQTVESSNNCYYNNPAGNTRGCSVSSSDIFIDPRKHETPSGWWWTGSEWECDQVKPSEMKGYSGNEYENSTITDEELEKYEWDYFISIFSAETSETGNIEQGDIKAVNPEWQKKGIAEAYIYLAGFEGKIQIDNVSYIPEKPSKCAIVLTNTRNLAERPTGQTSTLSLYDGHNNSLLAVLEVESFYEVKKYKTVEILGQQVKIPYYEEKSKNSTFSEIFDAPAIFPAVKPPKCYVRYYNGSHAIVIIPDAPGIVKTEIFLNNSSAREYRLIGEIGTAENGFKSTRFITVSTWKFTGSQMSLGASGLYIKEPFDIHDLKIEVTTPYETMEATDIEYMVIEDTSKKIINLGTLTLLVVIFIYGRPIYKISKREFIRWLKNL